MNILILNILQVETAISCDVTPRGSLSHQLFWGNAEFTVTRSTGNTEAFTRWFKYDRDKL